MPHSLFSHPVYLVVLVTVFLLWATPDVYENVTRRAKGNVTRSADGGSLELFRIFLSLSLIIAGLVAYFDPAGAIPGHQPWLFTAGASLVLGGLALRRWAVATLGRYFTVDIAVFRGQPVIDAPPYHRIRHPAYSGSILSLIGIGLMLGHWFSLALIMLTIMVTFTYRVRLEERALLLTLGEPYADYMRRTRRFIPFLW